MLIVNEAEFECASVNSSTKEPRRASEGWYVTPFTSEKIAIDSKARHVIMTEEAARSDEAPGAIVHELGHLHAIKGERIEWAHEWDWMGWEIAVAREARVMAQWSATMADYGIGELLDVRRHYAGDDWGGLTPYGKRVVAADRIAYARELGIVNKRGIARWARTHT